MTTSKNAPKSTNSQPKGMLRSRITYDEYTEICKVYPGRRRHRIKVGLSAHKSEALDGAGMEMGPFLLNGLFPFEWASVSFWTIIFSRTGRGVTSSLMPPGRTNPHNRGCTAGAENMPLLAGSCPPTGLSTTGALNPATHSSHLLLSIWILGPWVSNSHKDRI